MTFLIVTVAWAAHTRYGVGLQLSTWLARDSRSVPSSTHPILVPSGCPHFLG